jgi:hypothetical protein
MVDGFLRQAKVSHQGEWNSSFIVPEYCLIKMLLIVLQHIGFH